MNFFEIYVRDLMFQKSPFNLIKDRLYSLQEIEAKIFADNLEKVMELLYTVDNSIELTNIPPINFHQININFT